MLNPYIVIPLVCWIIAQTLKFIIAASRGRLDFRLFYASGGMPSAHAAVVSSLAVTSLLLDGLGSHLFGLTVVVAAIVMYDSFGVRRASGDQAKAINQLFALLPAKGQPQTRIREVLGHTPVEVIAGAVVGVVLGALFNISYLSTQLEWLAGDPIKLEGIAYTVLFALIIAAGWIVRMVISRRYRRSASTRSLKRQILSVSQTVGWLGLILSFSQYENLPYLSWRAWPIVLLLATTVLKLWLIKNAMTILPQAAAEAEHYERRRKWLEFGKGKRK